MQHLEILRIVNYVYAALLGIGALVLLAIVAGVGVGERALNGVTGLQAVNVVLLILTGLLALLAGLLVLAGSLVGRARGRVLQTVLAIVKLFEFPIGTVYGAYALWVCWIHDPSRLAFERHAPA